MVSEMRNSPDIGTIDWSDRVSLLICPRCGNQTLHHEKVTVFDREEDALTVVRTEIKKGVVSVDAAGSGTGNPSTRRDGIVIDFSCENCGDDALQLTFAQHKGSTEIGWRFELHRPDA